MTMIQAVILAVAFMTAQAQETKITLNSPARMTSHPAEDYMPQISPDGRVMAFVSNRSGSPNIWIKTIDSPEIPTPRRLTTGVSGEKSPRFSPDGKKMVYVSYSSDAEGDIYIIDLPAKISDLAAFEPAPKPVTDITTADKEPLFSADGSEIIFTSHDKSGALENLWSLDLKTGKRKQLTKEGGSSPAVSRDGSKIVFVSQRESSKSALYILKTGSGYISRLTSGEWTDSFPAFLSDTQVVFTRYADDTDLDGKITLEDNPALYAIDIFPPAIPPVALTTSESYNLFPSVSRGVVYYSAKENDTVDILRLPTEGIFPPFASLENEVDRALAVERFYPGRPYLALLGWRVAWARQHGSENRILLAECLARQADILKAMGDLVQAQKTLARLLELYPGQRRQAGLAKIEKILIESRIDGKTPAQTIRNLRTVTEDYGKIRAVEAKARIETGAAYLADGRPAKALEIFRAVVKQFGDIKPVAAEALYRRNGVYRLLNDKEKQIETYLDVIRSYPEQTQWVEKAIKSALQIALVKDDVKASKASLNSVIEKYADIPALQAAAMNRIAKLYYDDNELLRARDVYKLAVSRFPGQRNAKNHALFQIAKIHVEEERFSEAISVYRSIEQDTQAKRKMYEKSRKEFIRQSLRKGEYELAQGEVRVALKTFKSIVDYDPQVTEAHRGLIRCRAAMGEAARAVEHYERVLKEKPGDGVYLYSLALALTYGKPPSIGKAEKLIRYALVRNEKNPWYHQTLGWIYEQKEVKKKDGSYAEMALQEYGYGLALTDASKHPKRAADLRLNLGNVSYLLHNHVDAKNHYTIREASGVGFTGQAQESLFHQRWGEIEFKLGDDEAAVTRFKKALSLVKKSGKARKIEILERMGLAYQSSEKWGEAAGSFLESLKLRRSVGAVKNETVILRNIANNLFFLSQTGSGRDPKKLREALKFYHESEKALDKFKEKEREKEGGALITVEIETGARGVKTASKGFGKDDERKLLYHHIGRIYGELGDYKKAVEYFNKKLALTPRALPLLANVPVLTEKAIVLNQVGYYLAGLGETQRAIEKFSESLALSMRLQNATGLVTNADNMARLAIKGYDGLPEELVSRLIDSGAKALTMAAKDHKISDETFAVAYNHLAQLSHIRFKRKSRTPAGKEIAAQAAWYRKIAKDAAGAGKQYRLAGSFFSKSRTVKAVRGQINSSLNLATLLNDQGSNEEAADELNRAYEKAYGLHLYDMVWKIRLLRFLIDPVRYGRDLYDAASTLERVPFGYGPSENPAQTLAMIRTIYHNLAERAKNDGEALAALEKGRAMELKLMLAGLVKADLNDDAVPGVVEMTALYRKRELLSELFAGEAQKPGPNIEAIELRHAKVTAWEREYHNLIESLRFDNPLLADIAEPVSFDIESVAGSLDRGEAAVYFWRKDDGVTIFLITQLGLFVRHANDEKAVPALMVKDTALKRVTRLYLATDKPFSETLAKTLLSERFAVATIPSLSSVYHFKEKRNANDFRLAAFAVESKAMQKATAGFSEARFFQDEKAEKAVDEGALETSGVLLFNDPVAPVTGDLVRSRFPVSSAGQVSRWLSFSEIAAAGASGSLIITPPPSVKNGRDWEGGLLTLALLSGYSSWMITPEDEKSRNAFAESVLKNMRGESIATAFDIGNRSVAGSGRLAGSFGFTKREKLSYARSHFAGRIEAGAKAFKEKDWDLAADMLQQALVYTFVAGVEKYEALLLDRLAEIEFRRGRFKSALEYQEDLNAVYRSKKDVVKLADSLFLTGVIQTRLQRHEQAVKNMTTALNIYRREGLKQRTASTLSKLGLAEESFTRYGRALASYRAALEIRRDDGTNSGTARELLRIGRIYHLRLNQFEKARAAYKEAHDIFEDDGNTAMALQSLIDLGAVEEDAGDLDEAELLFRRVLREGKKEHDSKAVALAQFHLANVNWFRGAYEPALTWIRKAIKKAKSTGADRIRVMAMNTLGLIYITLNDYGQALLNLENSLALARSTGARFDEASALNNIGLAHRKMGKVEESIGFFRKARIIDEKLKSDWAVAYDARNMSISLLMLGDIAEAERMAEEAVDITQRIGDKVNGAKALLQLAEIQAAKKKWDVALAAYRQAERKASLAGVQETRWRALWGAGRVLRAKGYDETAAVAYKKAVDVVEKLRGAMKADELRQGFLEDKQGLYEELILLLLDMGAVRPAFKYAERARSRSFIDLLGRSKIRLKDERSQREYENVLELKRKLSEIEKAVALNGTDENLIARQRTLSSALERTLERLGRERPDILPFVTVRPVDAERILSLLDKDTALLEYVVTAKEIVIFVLGAGQIKAVRVALQREKLSELVFAYRALIQDSAPVGEEARRLGKALIDPVEQEIGGFKMIGIAPHGVLHYLSFASIMLSDGYLVDKFPLFYVPSASVYEHARKRRKPRSVEKTGVLALGNPDLGNYNTDLPLSELEALSIKRAFSNVDVFTRSQATETRLAGAGGKYQIVHIASHGQFDPANPLRSSLFLAADVENDGMLQVGEVFSLDFPVDLVTLSACQTGLGKVTKGDEVTGLSRAFIYSGARSILSTLWRVDDMASAILVKHFYRNFPGRTKAGALRKAQLAVKRRFPHPSFWAGFTLVGDYR